jgi:hypothetical protein
MGSFNRVLTLGVDFLAQPGDAPPAEPTAFVTEFRPALNVSKKAPQPFLRDKGWLYGETKTSGEIPRSGSSLGMTILPGSSLDLE